LLTRDKLVLTGIIVVSVVLRVAGSLYIGNQVVELPGTADQLSYQALATRVLDGSGFSFDQNWWPATKAEAATAHWSYLYTLFLVVVYSLFDPHPLVARLIQSVLVGILHPLLAYLLGRRVFSDIVGLVAAAWTALYGYFIYYSATLMTEPFYITAILGSLYLAILLVDKLGAQKREKLSLNYLILVILFGLILGIVVLLRQLFLLLIPFIFLWIWWACRCKPSHSPLQGLIVATMVIIILILPFTIFNYARFGRFVLLNTNAGYAFFWANHPIYGTHFESILPPDMGTYQDLIPEELISLDEAALDQALLRRGLQFVINDPVRYMRLSFSRIPAYFKFWPSLESSFLSNITRVASFGLALPFMLLGVGLWLKNGWRVGLRNMFASSSALLVLIALMYTIIHLLTWALIRYRLPVDAILLIFAAYGVVELFSRFKVWFISLGT
jgi:hypothetical protein